MVAPHNLHEIVPVAVERAVDSLVGGMLLCGIAWTWLRVARRQSSASRFFILFILLIGIAVLPFAVASLVANHSGLGSEAIHSLVTLPARTAEYLFVVWAAVAAALLGRVVTGFVQLQRLKRSCIAIDAASVAPKVRATLEGCARKVELCISDGVKVPTALGLTSPAKIVMPSWLMDQLSNEELHHLVLHETAHLRRWDDWTNFAQRVLGALLFFHPAIWWLQSRLSLEREMACDECVLAETGDARGYAKSLANVAERSFVRRSVALAQAAVSRLHETTLRVARILSPSPRKAHSRIGMMTSAAVFGGLSLAVTLYSPELVGFSAPESPTTANSIAAAAVTHASLRPILASLKTAGPAVSSRPVSKPTRQTNEDVASNHIAPKSQVQIVARGRRNPSVIEAKATRQHQTVAQPAMLVVYQASYTDEASGITVQETYWRVIVQQQITHKELPKTT
jgi:beta-lactamase regulating signal transducer with metallopeptidase domain